MAERQSWHSFIPYTDRIDYLGGVMNNLPYVLSVEKLAGIKVPEKVDVIRIMMAEFFRITSHLLFLGTYIQDVGAMTPVFFTFTDRQKRVHGDRSHYRFPPAPGLVPHRWRRPRPAARLGKTGQGFRRVDAQASGRIPESRTGQQHPAWPHHRRRRLQHQSRPWNGASPVPACVSTGCDFDLRKARPYSGYENFEFEVPLAANGDAYDRCIVRVEEMRQSIRIIDQCLRNMPEGPYKADHPLTTPPPKERTLQHIETLITHFLQVSWGPVMPANESFQMIEATKGINSYYLTSDGGTMSYRTRIRTPSFPHLQQIPSVIKGSMVADLIAYLGSIDFVMADVDR